MAAFIRIMYQLSYYVFIHLLIHLLLLNLPLNFILVVKLVILLPHQYCYQFITCFLLILLTPIDEFIKAIKVVHQQLCLPNLYNQFCYLCQASVFYFFLHLTLVYKFFLTISYDLIHLSYFSFKKLFLIICSDYYLSMTYFIQQKFKCFQTNGRHVLLETIH